MPAQYVKPYVKANKSDYIDAEAIAEAVQRPRMRFVPIKTEEQLDLQALHRVRERGLTLTGLLMEGLGRRREGWGYLIAKAADTYRAHTQYLSISFCSSPFALAFLATPFSRGDISDNKPVIFASAMLSSIAACLMLLGLDFLSVSPSAASP
jgi:hypothetical protein